MFTIFSCSGGRHLWALVFRFFVQFWGIFGYGLNVGLPITSMKVFDCAILAAPKTTTATARKFVIFCCCLGWCCYFISGWLFHLWLVFHGLNLFVVAYPM